MALYYLGISLKLGLSDCELSFYLKLIGVKGDKFKSFMDLAIAPNMPVFRRSHGAILCPNNPSLTMRILRLNFMTSGLWYHLSDSELRFT
jgi:hypothetical protein